MMDYGEVDGSINTKFLVYQRFHWIICHKDEYSALKQVSLNSIYE